MQDFLLLYSPFGLISYIHLLCLNNDLFFFYFPGDWGCRPCRNSILAVFLVILVGLLWSNTSSVQMSQRYQSQHRLEIHGAVHYSSNHCYVVQGARHHRYSCLCSLRAICCPEGNMSKLCRGLLAINVHQRGLVCHELFSEWVILENMPRQFVSI